MGDIRVSLELIGVWVILDFEKIAASWIGRLKIDAARWFHFFTFAILFRSV